MINQTNGYSVNRKFLYFNENADHDKNPKTLVETLNIDKFDAITFRSIGGSLDSIALLINKNLQHAREKRILNLLWKYSSD